MHCKPRGEGACERCSPRGLDCSFDRHNSDAATDQPIHKELLSATDCNTRRVPLSFLLNSTDENQEFFTEKVVGSEPDGVPLGPTCFSSIGLGFLSDELTEYLDPSTLLFLNPEPCDPSGELSVLDPSSGNHNFDHTDFTLSADFSISARLDMLEKELATYAYCNPHQQAPFDSTAYRSLFNVQNVRNFAATFCRKRHYQYPIIHWPTFDLATAPLPLFLVVALTGAAYSFCIGDGIEYAFEARKFYNLADAYVFQQLDMHIEGLPTRDDPACAIQLCQAALLMFALDTLPVSDAPMQHVAVSKRLPTLISAMRTLEFVGLRHDPGEDWSVFIDREQIIRIVAWTYCADCLATLSCNKPPGFSLLEMRGELPCDSNVWEADAVSFAECREYSRRTSHSLIYLVFELLKGDSNKDIEKSGLPVFHLQVLLCGQSHVYFILLCSRLPHSALTDTYAF